MNANDFFEQYSIEVINKRTRISPISLRYIKNREFEKISRVKFLGFVRIIEKEFNIDLSELVEEYNEATKHRPEQTHGYEEIKYEEPKKHNTFILFILSVMLFSLGAYLLYTNYNTEPVKEKELNSSTFISVNDKNSSEENNSQESLQKTAAPAASIPAEQNTTSVNKSKSSEKQDSNTSAKEENETKKTASPASKETLIPEKVEIIPNKKVWFKAYNLDTNKSIQYLTSSPKTLKGGNWYIKFGHGEVSIRYGDKTITPNSKQITRILLKNGEFKYLKKSNRYEK